MSELNNTSRFPKLSLEVSLQDTRTLGCKPSKAKISEEWFSNTDKCPTSSSLPTQNSDSLSDIEVFQDSPSQSSQSVSVKDFKGSNFDNGAFEAKMEAQRRTLLEAFDNQMTKKMEEMDQKICKRWEEAVAKMHEKYGQKVEKYGDTLKEIQIKNEESSQRKLQLEQQLNEKYQNEYLEKLEALNEDLSNGNPDKAIDVICEVKAKLEMDCEKNYERQIQTKREEIKQETEQLKKEQYREIFKGDLAVDIDKKLKTAYETAMADLSMQNQKEIVGLKKTIKELEQGHAYERIKSELLEEMKREYIVKEEEINKQLKEKLTTSKKEVEGLIEQQRTRRLSQEYLDIAVEKKGMGSTARDNSRVKRAEEVNKDLEKKLAEREEKYLKTVEELKKELDELKLSRNIPLSGRVSARNTSSERETKRSTYQRNSSRSTERTRRSCESSFSELSVIRTTTVESASKTVNTRSRRETWSSDKKKVNKAVDKNTSDLMKSSEVKKNLNEALMKESVQPKHSPLGQYYQPFSTERTAKALLQMLSPSTPSDIQYLQADTRLESMQGPVSELTRNTITIIEEPYEVKEGESNSKEEVIVASPKSYHQRSSSGMLSERGRGMANMEKEVPSLFEDALKQRDTNFHMRRASFTDKKLDFKDLRQQETERSSKNTERVYTSRYEELLKRQRSGSKKRGNSISHKKENVAGVSDKSIKRQGATTRRNFDNQENVLTERKYSAKNVLRNIFEIRDNDDEETKTMKKLKMIVEEQISENDLLASKCQKKEVDLCINIPWKTGVQSAEQEKTLQEKLKTLFELWKAVEISSVARLAFMEDLERLIRYDDILHKISNEINHIAQLATETEPITKLLTWRGQLRDQIKAADFSCDLYEKLCSALENNNKELREALEFYQRENGKLVQFKGVDLREIIKVDSWENEYVRNTQPQLNMDQKLKQKAQ